jgi:LPS export ABC transporter protein LptC
MSVYSFYKKHKTLLLMASPLLLGLSFFAVSAVFALISIKRTQVPQNFERVNFKVKNYQVVEIDRGTNNVKWSLNARSAETSPDELTAKVKDPTIKLFEGGQSYEYLITAESAFLNRTAKEVNLYDNVNLQNQDGRFLVKAGALKFADNSENISVDHDWKLSSKADYEISGEHGLISKDFKSVLSQGHAVLEKADINLKADEISLNSESDQAVTAQGNVVLKLDNNKALSAKKIIISKDGSVEAYGAVKVTTSDLTCFSDQLNIAPNHNKSPKLAVFSGNPHILKNHNMIYADSVRYDFQSQEALVEGNVRSNQ